MEVLKFYSDRTVVVNNDFAEETKEKKNKVDITFDVTNGSLINVSGKKTKGDRGIEFLSDSIAANGGALRRWGIELPSPGLPWPVGFIKAQDKKKARSYIAPLVLQLSRIVVAWHTSVKPHLRKTRVGSSTGSQDKLMTTRTD
jgi:hypothetical protein